MKMPISLGIAFVLSACASTGERLPSWNLPEKERIEVLSISYLHGGIGNVQVSITPDDGEAYCIIDQIYSGRPSNIIASDLLNDQGRVIPFEDRGVLADEDMEIRLVPGGSTTHINLNYNGIYSENGPKGRSLQFRVVLPAQRCSSEDIGAFSPDVVLVSAYAPVILSDY